MTYRRLPSLVPLRSFEAAARHGSVTRAANELSVTPGAVSRGVRALEEEIGTPLFRRGPGGLSLTPAGETLFAAAREGLDRIAAGVAATRHAPSRAGLRLCAYAFFASRWLLPRWGGLRERHPDLELELETRADPLDVLPDRFDAAIAVTDGRARPGLSLMPLIPIEMMPVCAPALLAPDGLDWRTARLLHSRQRPDDWARWLASAGIAGPGPQGGSVFESIGLALDAAAEGLGVALTIRGLAGGDLASGRVVVAHPHVRTTTRCFAFLHRAERRHEPGLVALKSWLAEALLEQDPRA